MELRKYYNYYLRSYIISFFFFRNYFKIIFIKKLKIILKFFNNLNLIFIFFIFYFLIFNKKFWFYNKVKFNSFFIIFSKSKIFDFLQFFILTFLTELNRSFSIFFNINKNFLSLNLKQLVLTYINRFLFKLNFNNFLKMNFLLFLNNFNNNFKLLIFRLFLFPIEY